MDIIYIIIWIAVIIIAGGGGAIWIFMSTRKPKRIWNAKVYQLSEGTREHQIIDGELTTTIKLKDLRPYCKDRLVLNEKEHGIKIYTLKGLDLTCKAVTADDVDVWGKDDKEVNVLVVGETATILKKGYDYQTGTMIFTPLPRERMDLMKSEILLKKDRLKEKSGLIEKVIPYVVIGISLLSLVAIAYFNGESYIKTSDNFRKTIESQSEDLQKIAETYRDGSEALGQSILRASGTESTKKPISDVGIQKINKSEVPSIE